MVKILEKRLLNETNILMRVGAPDIARAAKAGQFLMLRVDDQGERIPLTIADSDDSSVTIVFQVVGKTTEDLSILEAGDDILDLMGPLGRPSEIENFGRVAVVGGGLGIAPCYPIAKALKEAGNKVISILGARNKELFFWLDLFQDVSDEVILCTDDGSAGMKGLVTDALLQLKEKEKLDRVVAVGPMVMMKFVVKAAGEIPAVVSLNPIMIDGMGMCGGCRVNVAGKVKFACVDGPEFMGQDVDWDSLMQRSKAYVEEEHKCRIGRG